MNRLISIPFLLVTCALCFAAGYKLGQDSQPPALIVTEPPTKDAPLESLTDTANQLQVSVARPLVVESTQNPLEVRAQKTVQTFFDKNERKLVAEILEVSADSLKVRRQSDGKELKLPVAMLSADDQAFAAYLWQQQPKRSAAPAPSTNQSMEDMIWDELFK